MIIDGFKIYKTKWYVISVDRKDLYNRHILSQHNTKEIAECYADDYDRIDLNTYGDFTANRYIVKGEQIPIWFR